MLFALIVNLKLGMKLYCILQVLSIQQFSNKRKVSAKHLNTRGFLLRSTTTYNKQMSSKCCYQVTGLKSKKIRKF